MFRRSYCHLTRSSSIFLHPRTVMPSTSREQSIMGCSLHHTDRAGKGRNSLLLSMNRVIFSRMIEGERGNHAVEPRCLAQDENASTSHLGWEQGSSATDCVCNRDRRCKRLGGPLAGGDPRLGGGFVAEHGMTWKVHESAMADCVGQNVAHGGARSLCNILSAPVACQANPKQTQRARVRMGDLNP